MSVRWDVDRSKLDPQFADDVHDLLAASEYPWVVTYGFRSAEEQDALYAKGRTAPGPIVTNAKAGHSPHEFGLAVDVAILTPNGASWKYDTPAWPWLWEACKAHPRLRSGHFFPPKAPADDDHCEAVNWVAKRNELEAQGKW